MIFKPQEGPQTDFCSSPEDEVFYGGAKGGGKTFGLMLDATRQVHIPGYRAILFRRTYPSLQEIVDRSHSMYGRMRQRGRYPKWSGSRKTWTFPSGAIIKFAHCQYEKDKHIYQGQEYHWMGFDQLETFTESLYLFLIAQNRCTVPNVQKFIRSTGNPGGIGHAWVFRRFMVDPETDMDLEPGTVIRQEFEIPFDIGMDYDKIVRSRVFIPSTVFDNKILIQSDPDYLANLMQLPEKERKALLEGDWHSFAGQYFSEWSRLRHVIDPFEIPSHWPRFRMIDHGSAAPYAGLWCAVDEEGTVYVYREHYAAGHRARTNAQKVLELSQTDLQKGKYLFSVIDPSVFSKTGQDLTIGEIHMEEGLDDLEPAPNERLAGWQVIKDRLHYDDETGHEPTLLIFSTCRNLIRTLPSMVHDELKPEDLDTDGEDHAVDALRYGLMRLRQLKSKSKPRKPGTGSQWGQKTVPGISGRGSDPRWS